MRVAARIDHRPTRQVQNHCEAEQGPGPDRIKGVPNGVKQRKIILAPNDEPLKMSLLSCPSMGGSSCIPFIHDSGTLFANNSPGNDITPWVTIRRVFHKDLRGSVEAPNQTPPRQTYIVRSE